MKAHVASAVNAAVLIGCSIWAYWAIGMTSATALIPALFGVALLLCFPGVRAENKAISHVAVLLTVVVLFALYMPLASAIASGEVGPLVRALAMVASTFFALAAFLKSFRDARRPRRL